MENEFIPYEQALSLKELGFDEPCFATYRQWDGREPYIHLGTDIEADNFTIECDAPLYQQAFRWFREKYGLHTWITSKTNDKGETVFIPQGRTIPDTIKNNLTVDIIPYYTGKSSEEAELECLKKLIEICGTQEK